ncbi:MAG TPA: NifU family protein [Iamia sp.]
MDATDTDTPVDQLVLRLSDDALATVTGIRDAEDEPDGLALRVEVTGARGTDFTYDLAFEPVADASPDDAVTVQGGMTVWIPAGSVAKLKGATLDVPSREGQGGLVLRNPNRPDPLGMDGGAIELTGTIAEKVKTLLDAHVNPALASHGGFAELVKVDDTAVHISMGGGCQGCAVSAMTLRDGIEKAIKEQIPEVTEVIDTTDHGAGENPFYTDDPYA